MSARTAFPPRVPVEHPLRGIKRYADAVLRSMNAEFDRLYASTGRPSIPPEWLLKASLLIALYSVLSRPATQQQDARLDH